MKKIYLAAIAIVAFSGSVLASNVKTPSQSKITSSFLIEDPSKDYVYAYLVKTVDGRDIYIQGRQCALDYIERNSGELHGLYLVSPLKAYKCAYDQDLYNE
jgi:hypothetical protein